MADDELYDDMTDDELADILSDFDDDELDDLEELAEGPDAEREAIRAYIGFDRLAKKLQAKGHDEESSRRIAAAIGRRKYGKEFDKLREMSRRARLRMEKAARSQAAVSSYTYDRVWTLDDIEIIRGGSRGDGRTVSAYAAIYGTPTEVRDQFGHYMEVIDRAAFRRTLQHGDITKRVTVLYNHGLGLNGEHHPLGSVPIGSPLEIRSDNRGLLTVTRFNKSELADAVLEAIRAGDIRGYSFRGRVFKSTPDRVPRAARGGQLPVIVRNELGLAEYGPTPIPYYSGAAVVAIRSQAIAEAMRLPERDRIIIARALLNEQLEDVDPDTEEPVDTEIDDVAEEYDDSEVEPDEGVEDETSTTPDSDSGEDVEGEDPEDDSPTDSDESPGTEGPPDEAPLPVSQAARSLSAADVARKARVALILRGGGN